jgi:hypothetical protein
LNSTSHNGIKKATYKLEGRIGSTELVLLSFLGWVPVDFISGIFRQMQLSTLPLGIRLIPLELPYDAIKAKN